MNSSFCKHYHPLLIHFFLLSTLFLFSSIDTSGQTCLRQPFRTIDGNCNNIYFSDWGKANTPLLRELPALYASTNPYSDMITGRPNPRAISNAICAQNGLISSNSDLSSFVFTWGQFIDHDIGVTPAGEERANIPLPANEPHLSIDLSFKRSVIQPGTGVFNSRMHPNEHTAWIDGSQVYGAEQERADWLRTKVNGKLKVSTGNLLPYNTFTGEANSEIDPHAPEMDDPFRGEAPLFVAGDFRANEQPGLTALHTLFVREHNRICEELMAQGIVGDEQIYQLARKKVGALIQAITYQEFLPALGITLNPYYGYIHFTRPDILTEFSTAAFRIGHTMVTEQLLFLDTNCRNTQDPISLEQAFFNASWVANNGIESLLKGLSVQTQQEIDAKIIDGLRNFLFNLPGLPGGIGLDLASLNIQRGRDHGLQDYNTIRSHFTGSRIFTFDQINSDPSVWRLLARVYNNDINNIDPWVGMLCETPVGNSSLGMTMHQILKIQFERLREGDFYYYKNDPLYNLLEVAEIENTRLSTIITRNTQLDGLPADVFRVSEASCNVVEEVPVDLCEEISITVDRGLVNIEGRPGNNYFFQLHNAFSQVLYQCNIGCGFQETITNLSSGVYRVFIFDANREKVCMEEIEIEEDNTIFDNDRDGVLSILDCNDNNPNITVVGATCDDGNISTVNDRVKADCTCAGEPLFSFGNQLDITPTTFDRSPFDNVMDNSNNPFENIFNTGFNPFGGSRIITGSLYPNPSTNTVFLAVDQPILKRGQLSVYNSIGQKVISTQIESIGAKPLPITVTSLDNGIYFFQLSVDREVVFQDKLIIKK